MGYKERLKQYRDRADAIYARVALEKKARTNKRLHWFEDHSLTTPEAIFQARFGLEKDISNAMVWRQLMIEQNRRAQNTKEERDWTLFRMIQRTFCAKREAAKQTLAENQEKLRRFQLQCRTLSYGDDGQAGQGVPTAEPQRVPGSE